MQGSRLVENKAIGNKGEGERMSAQEEEEEKNVRKGGEVKTRRRTGERRRGLKEVKEHSLLSKRMKRVCVCE